jgi:anti-sigma B factor antagonist
MNKQDLIKTSTVGDITVVHLCQPRITDPLAIEVLGQELYHLVEHGQHKKLILNFSAVEFLSSATLGKLISLHGKVKAHQGAIRLCNIRPQILAVFRICRLDHVFEIKQEEADALVSF